MKIEVKTQGDNETATKFSIDNSKSQNFSLHPKANLLKILIISPSTPSISSKNSINHNQSTRLVAETLKNYHIKKKTQLCFFLILLD
jgi:hypothetical protein